MSVSSTRASGQKVNKANFKPKPKRRNAVQLRAAASRCVNSSMHGIGGNFSCHSPTTSSIGGHCHRLHRSRYIVCFINVSSSHIETLSHLRDSSFTWSKNAGLSLSLVALNIAVVNHHARPGLMLVRWNDLALMVQLHLKFFCWFHACSKHRETAPADKRYHNLQPALLSSPPSQQQPFPVTVWNYCSRLTGRLNHYLSHGPSSYGGVAYFNLVACCAD